MTLKGKHVLVTAGPTHEPIDPVRVIANRSSGKQGHAIARAAAGLGARVTLVTGPVALPDPQGVDVVHVETAQEMFRAVERSLPADVAVFAAAVADWRTAAEAQQKLKKSGDKPSLDLVENRFRGHVLLDLLDLGIGVRPDPDALRQGRDKLHQLRQFVLGEQADVQV